MSISSHASEWSSFSTLPFIIHSAPHANLLNKHTKSYADDDEAAGDEKHITDVILTFVIAIDPEKLLNKEPVVTRPKSFHSGSSSSTKGHNNFMYYHLEYSLLNKDNFSFSTDVVVFSKYIAKIYPDNCSSKLTKPCEFNNTLWIVWTEQIPILITDEMIIDFWNLTQNGGIRIKCWDQRDKCSIQTRFDRPRSVNSGNKPTDNNFKDDINLSEFQSVINALNSYCKHSMNLQMNSSNVDSVTEKCEKTLQPIIKNRTKYMNTINQSSSSKMKVLSTGQSSLKTDKIQDFIDSWGTCCLVLQTGHLFRINPPRWIVARKPMTYTNYTSLNKLPQSSIVLELDNNFKDILVGIKLSNPLMSTRQRQKFQPIILTIDRLHNLPVTPYRNYEEMRNICEPIRLVTNFSNFWNHQSREYIQDKDVYMDEVQVILTYNIPVPYLRELLYTLPIVIDVYDRVCYQNETNENKQSFEYGLFCTEPDDDKIGKVQPNLKTNQNNCKTNCKTSTPTGRVNLDLSEFIWLKCIKMKQKLPILPISETDLDLLKDYKFTNQNPRSIPRSYIGYVDNQCELFIEIEVNINMDQLLQIDITPEYTQIVERMVFILEKPEENDMDDNYYSEIIEKINLFILKSNARSLGISDELPLNVIKANINSKQSQYMPCIHSKSSTSLLLHSSINKYNDINIQSINKLITGFHLNDEDFDLFIFETANIQISKQLEIILLSIQLTLIITEECPKRCVCMGQTIRCQNAGFRIMPKLPNIVPSQDGGVLEYLIVVENSISTLEKASFEGHLDLLRLELFSNQIARISVEAFIGLPMLKVLVLRSNRLTHLPQEVFTPIYTLEELDLSNNQLKHIPISIEGLIYLKRLSLGDNHIHCPCELVDFSLSLMYVESKSSRVTCYSPPQVRNIRLSDLADRLRTLVNQTRLLGYQALSDPERNKVVYSEPYQLPYGYRPWPHCPRKDFGGMTPRLLAASDKDYETRDPTSNNVNNNSPTLDNAVYSENRAPTLAVQLQNVKVVAGEVARFICRSEPDVVGQITWILPVKATRYMRLYRRRQILEITEAHDYHEGSYICVLSNSYGVVTSEANLQLIQPTKPTIIEAPPADDNAVAEYSILDLRCTAKGLPKPYISWVWQKETLPLQLVTGGRYIVRSYSTEINPLQFQFQNNLSIYATDQYILAENEKTETMSVLLIRNVTTEDAHGRYTCYVANRLGSARVSTVIRVLTDNSYQVASKSEIQNNATTENEDINYKSSNYKSDDGDDLVKEIIEKARIRIETAIRKTADRLRDTGRRRSSADIASLFRQPNRAALELAKAAEVYEAAIDEVTSILRQRNQKHFEFNKTETIPDEFKEHDEIDPNSRDTYGVELNTDQLAIIAQLSGCQSSQQVDPCSRQLCFHLRYRSIDGTCNNLNHPRWGAALVPFRRLLPPRYENGMNTPIGWSSTKLYFGYPKPSARLVSRELLGNASLMVELSKIVEAYNKQMKMRNVHENSTMSTSLTK
ncbi:hypothetical protein MN116_004706, partial [Schistosoma mekongi]